MKTIILCGGKGTRIRDVSDDIPKPMIEIGNKPILWHIMNHYANCGFSEFLLCLGYKGNTIKDFFLNYRSHTSDFSIDFSSDHKVTYHTYFKPLNWKVTFADTGLNAMTGARIYKVRDYIEDDQFMITYGDGLSNIRIKELVEYHKKHGKILTITGVRPPSRFGEIAINENNLVMEFNEKPQSIAGLISGGYFVANKNIFKYLSDNDELVFEQDPIKKLVEDEEVMVYPHKGFWQPMDTRRDYYLLNKLYEDEEAPWTHTK